LRISTRVENWRPCNQLQGSSHAGLVSFGTVGHNPAMTDNDGRWLAVADAAAILRISPRSVRRWAAEGALQVDRSRRPYLVFVTGQRLAEAGQRPDMADMTDMVATELEGLRAENERLRERVQELTQERDYLRLLSASLASGQQRLLEARRRRRWWQRRKQ